MHWHVLRRQRVWTPRLMRETWLPLSTQAQATQVAVYHDRSRDRLLRPRVYFSADC